MDIKSIKNNFTCFGNFSTLLNLEQGLISAFKGYKYNKGQEKLPNGQTTPVFRFNQDNVAVTLHVFRIDIEYGYTNAYCNIEAFMQIATTMLKKIAGVNMFFANRVAVSTVNFIPNPDKSIVMNCNRLFHTTDLFEAPSDEFQLRLNHIHQMGTESYNSVVNLQDGKVTNNETKEVMDVFFINTDVNTLIGNRNERFNPRELDSYLGDMVMETKESVEKIADYISDTNVM